MSLASLGLKLRGTPHDQLLQLGGSDARIDKDQREPLPAAVVIVRRRPGEKGPGVRGHELLLHAAVVDGDRERGERDQDRGDRD
jgi:hypothetical protein